VRHAKRLRSRDQLALFHAQPTTPPWMAFPPETREQTLRLLARLLWQFRRARLLAREVRDE